MKLIYSLLFCFLMTSHAIAANRTIHLVVDYKDVKYAGKTVKAIAINNRIPAPTLHFKEGEQVTIHVDNRLREETALHWHGLLVPWQMDGVLGVTQRGIQPGQHFTYQFKIMQSGTYWYHAHAGLQEQQGMYGALIIDPTQSPAYRYSKDYIIVLSDWSNTHPEQILANLKKDGDYYSPNFPLQPSLLKFIQDYRKANSLERRTLIADYKMMQQMRMSIYDINDIAYDAFLLNGATKNNLWRAPVKVDDVVRLRFIGAGAETIFRVKIPDATMKMVHIEGNDIKPYPVKEFTIAPGETYDVLVKITQDKPYLIYAESLDTVGAALGALTTRSDQIVNDRMVTPFPEPLPVTRDMKMDHGSMSGMSMADMPEMKMKMDHSSMANRSSMKMDHKKMNHQPMANMPMTHMSSMSAMDSPTLTTGTKYQNLVAKNITNDPNKPITDTIKMDLTGYMNRFMWSINGVSEFKAKPILLQPGKRYRLIFTNRTMMRHPMHIHGHWFILRNGHGAYDPLLHTIEVAPSSTVVVDLDTDASGQWFFHCHMAYHMAAGMARTFQYTTLIDLSQDKMAPENIVQQTAYKNRPIVRVDEVRPLDKKLVQHPAGHHAGIWSSTLIDAGADPFYNTQRLTFKGLYGSDYHKLELFANDAELNQGSVENADIDIFYWRLISPFWAIKGGVNYFYRPALTPYWQPGIGIEGLMPYFIDTDIRSYYKSGSFKLDAEFARDTQMTNNFFVRLGVRSILATKTVSSASLGSGLNQMRYIVRPYYRLMPGLSIFAEYEHEDDYGVFKNLQLDEAFKTNTVTLGLSVLL